MTDERTADDPVASTDGGTTVPTDSVDAVLDSLDGDGLSGYNYAYLDEHTKREVRRATLKAVAVPGHQVPYASRPMPLARGWGTGGIQASLSLLGPDETFKVVDQGADESVNAANIRRLAENTADVETTTDTTEAGVVQTRHRIPEEVLTDEQILVLQVPITDPLRKVDSSDAANRRRHAHKNYGKMWVHLYENVVEWGEINIASRYPTMVAERYLMDPSPIPRWDVPKLDDAENLYVFAAGREARIYAVPPHTDVEPLAFEDREFTVERFPDAACHACGSTDTYLVEVSEESESPQTTREEGGGEAADSSFETRYACNDSSFCEKRREDSDIPKDHHLDREGVDWGPGTPDNEEASSGGAGE
ncbi:MULTISPECIES: alpha-D-ribose 1-methylphosphonate 5-phosphate C-P-lyase PhnJ [Haloarcula]|uniref:Carbon-phosphorus lyase complex subunit PhnJ n=1 Tax=Haloarcula pellucida TaxID=1427151 RepID=A0A830GR16_9EURY|nr:MULTISPECIES: alpha-D-ribose 1-methylphosphonate 5-phosphate C-P-lyase PhnJ [Halomicroarcula]MBX0348208.1 alpha-D-ribose 1-methylphosphonate 5-phosphate C-P-lyase PhnJ [Halomicroarcula pellucida]MDS0278062.1 alpha-D-ribose 1-methylphosphonate 5-phosphate C-P-lyase PhnJ [Halomicroarcula sp. S1AR25-4]GGN97496.1 carbon-phosphorus lyase complex subunit PhnJ [Halomicroarcula pellucida]